VHYVAPDEFQSPPTDSSNTGAKKYNTKVELMERSSKRGKIPQSDWPLIMARYEAGETLASIARTYDCSPPAISYVVSRSRARPVQPPPAKAPGGSAQLLKSLPADPAGSGTGKPLVPVNGNEANGETVPRAANGFYNGNGAGHAERPIAAAAEPPQTLTPPAAQARPVPPPMAARPAATPASAAPAPVAGVPAAQPAGAANGDHRRKLHLSLGGAPQAHAGSHHHAPGNGHAPGSEIFAPRGERPQQHPEPDRRQDSFGANAGQPRPAAPSGQNGERHGDDMHRKENGGSFIDRELRNRVEGDIAAFFAAFDAALAEDTVQSRSALREATDRLLRAGARTRIELERLEARMPLPPRDHAGRGNLAWRER